MSKLGKKPIAFPEGVEAELKDDFLAFKGPKGELNVPILPYVKVELTREGQILLHVIEDNAQAKANFGTMASLVINAISGVSKGFFKNLKLEGVGYKAALEGGNLVLNVGFSHPVEFKIPTGIFVAVEKNNVIKVEGIDKQLVGEVAARIRKIRKPEPYKGKGIRYENEIIRRKAGKKAVGSGA